MQYSLVETVEVVHLRAALHRALVLSLGNVTGITLAGFVRRIRGFEPLVLLFHLASPPNTIY